MLSDTLFALHQSKLHCWEDLETLILYCVTMQLTLLIRMSVNVTRMIWQPSLKKWALYASVENYYR